MQCLALSASHMETTDSKFLMLFPHNTHAPWKAAWALLENAGMKEYDSPTWWSRRRTEMTMTKTDTPEGGSSLGGQKNIFPLQHLRLR